jgi:tRNA-Thr(GGU) m(6)t(6)A37 methyltransferase TsaA
MENKKAELKFIGIVESVNEFSKIRIFQEFCDGLQNINEFSHLIILYWFHLKDNEYERSILKVIPKRHRNAPQVGVFASRSPSRPNPIGLCIVELIKIEDCILIVKGLDAFEGSPIIDIKPYLPEECILKVKAPKWALHKQN